MKKIILVTHGEVEQDLPDPCLTKKGKEQMKKLRFQLPKNLDYVISGIGRRHKEACRILIGRKADFETEVVGVSETLSSDGKNMIFPDGKKIYVEEYAKTRYKDSLQKILPFLKQILKRPDENILIVGGRITAIGAGIPAKKTKSACVYHIWLTPLREVKIREELISR